MFSNNFLLENILKVFKKKYERIFSFKSYLNWIPFPKFYIFTAIILLHVKLYKFLKPDIFCNGDFSLMHLDMISEAWKLKKNVKDLYGKTGLISSVYDDFEIFIVIQPKSYKRKKCYFPSNPETRGGNLAAKIVKRKWEKLWLMH